MPHKLKEIAQQLLAQNNKVQLIYAFNGTGKTRLSREFKELVDPKTGDDESPERKQHKVLYYSAFTEDLFYWDNDLELDQDRRLCIQDNSFTDWVLGHQGLDRKIIGRFQQYTNDKLTPHFNAEERNERGEITKRANTEVTFSITSGSDEQSGNIKISKGEESNFIWSIFFTFISEVVATLAIPEEESRDTQDYNELKYIFIDDPVSSLDENHLMSVAVDLAQLIKSTGAIKFIISTHNAYFYHILYNELNSRKCHLLEKLEDGTYKITEKMGESNSSFSYHLHLKHQLQKAIIESTIERQHFVLLRNLYERTASFLGFQNWGDLLPTNSREAYYNRIIQYASHSKAEVTHVAYLAPQEKAMLKFLFNHLINTPHTFKTEQQNIGEATVRESRQDTAVVA